MSRVLVRGRVICGYAARPAAMTEHLPECGLTEPCPSKLGLHQYVGGALHCAYCGEWCICRRLRAYLTRVLDEADHTAWSMALSDRELNTTAYRKLIAQVADVGDADE